MAGQTYYVEIEGIAVGGFFNTRAAAAAFAGEIEAGVVIAVSDEESDSAFAPHPEPQENTWRRASNAKGAA